MRNRLKLNKEQESALIDFSIIVQTQPNKAAEMREVLGEREFAMMSMFATEMRLEKLEKEFELPARSAKAVVPILLNYIHRYLKKTNASLLIK